MPTTFDPDLISAWTPEADVSTASSPVVDTEAVVKQNLSKRHLLSDPADWDWQALRDYVVDQIISRTGNFPRKTGPETGIFKGFCSRWGGQAGAIATYAFEGPPGGWWKGSPIRVERFAKGSDPYFASEIAKHLDD